MIFCYGQIFSRWNKIVFIININDKMNLQPTQRALYDRTMSIFSLEQRNDLISTKSRRCSNIMWPLGNRLANMPLKCGALSFKLSVLKKTHIWTPFNV